MLLQATSYFDVPDELPLDFVQDAIERGFRMIRPVHPELRGFEVRQSASKQLHRVIVDVDLLLDKADDAVVEELLRSALECGALDLINEPSEGRPRQAARDPKRGPLLSGGLAMMFG